MKHLAFEDSSGVWLDSKFILQIFPPTPLPPAPSYTHTHTHTAYLLVVCPLDRFFFIDSGVVPCATTFDEQ